jgi:Glucosidase II beta subunit-like protein
VAILLGPFLMTLRLLMVDVTTAGKETLPKATALLRPLVWTDECVRVHSSVKGHEFIYGHKFPCVITSSLLPSIIALPSSDPTYEPSNPTYDPTEAPSNVPAYIPTYQPSIPTYDPTTAPSFLNRFASLQGSCLVAQDNSCFYPTCFFKDVKQFSNYDGELVAIVGNFGAQLSANSFRIEDGDYCDVIQDNRAGLVIFDCGSSTSAVAVESPTCFYTMTFTSPSYCFYPTYEPSAAPTLAQTFIPSEVPAGKVLIFILINGTANNLLV